MKTRILFLLIQAQICWSKTAVFVAGSNKVDSELMIVAVVDTDDVKYVVS